MVPANDALDERRYRAMTDLEDHAAAVAEARRLGEVSGSELDTRLRARERDERAELWARAREAASRPSGAVPGHLMEESAGLRQELDALRHFRQAVTDSKGWKAVQALRRFVGRGWAGYD